MIIVIILSMVSLHSVEHSYIVLGVLFAKWVNNLKTLDTCCPWLNNKMVMFL